MSWWLGDFAISVISLCKIQRRSVESLWTRLAVVRTTARFEGRKNVARANSVYAVNVPHRGVWNLWMRLAFRWRHICLRQWERHFVIGSSLLIGCLQQDCAFRSACCEMFPSPQAEAVSTLETWTYAELSCIKATAIIVLKEKTPTHSSIPPFSGLQRHMSRAHTWPKGTSKNNQLVRLTSRLVGLR